MATHYIDPAATSGGHDGTSCLDVPPIPSVVNAANGFTGNSKFPSNGTEVWFIVDSGPRRDHGFQHSLYLYRLCVCEFGLWQSFSEWLASLCYHVGLVVVVSAKEKMVGSDARRIVTFMKNMQSVWDRTVMNFIGYAMRPIAMLYAPIPHFAVSLFRFTASPIPASVRLFGLGPKSFCCCISGIVSAARERCFSVHEVIHPTTMSVTGQLWLHGI